MENKEIINSQDIQIQGLVDRYLRSQNSERHAKLPAGEHLNEDSLAAFTEGNMSEREAQPVVSHLVDCSFCRHVTTELIRLDLAFADESVRPLMAEAVENQPSKVSEVLSNLLSRIFGTNDGAVFAHEEKKEDSEKTEDSENSKK